MRYLLKISFFVCSFYVFILLSSSPSFAFSNVWEWNRTEINAVEKDLDGTISVTTGKSHSVALKSDGTVLAWGDNTYGQLGNGESGGESTIPIQVKGLNGEGFLNEVKEIVAGDNFNMALKNDGTVVTWGQNAYGGRGAGVGKGDYLSLILTPLLVKNENQTNTLSGITSISADGNHSLALSSTGTVYSWGSNGYGEAGIGCFLHSCSLLLFPRQVLNISNVKEIAAGGFHSLALTKSGEVWGWGRTFEKQLGSYSANQGAAVYPIKISELSGINSISAKGMHSVALSYNGLVFYWGWNKLPRQIENLSNVKDVSTGYLNGLALKNDGTVWEWNVLDFTLVKIENLTEINSIAAAGQFAKNLAVSKAETAPTPFLDLPWDYESKGMTFNDAALSINSYFDHTYPLLSAGIGEGFGFINQVTIFDGSSYSQEERSYSKHDGYDYGYQAQTKSGEPLLAPASGTAVYVNICSSCGNAIHIDHGNGYQTRYYHLQKEGLITSVPNQGVPVIKGQTIGKVGYTGNCWVQDAKGNGIYNTPACSHIHFMLVQDKNNDGNFSDNIPDGLTDPFGWQSEESDPWETFTFIQNGVQKLGNKSFYLWIKKLDGLKENLGSNGGVFNAGRYSVEFPKDATNKNLTLEMKSAPIERVSDSLFSLGPTIEIIAKDSLGALVTLFTKPMTISIDFSQADISRFKPETISIYSSSDGMKTWQKESSFVDYLEKKATAEVNHLTYFGVFGERKDITPPITEVKLHGEMGEENWFRSEVLLTLSATNKADKDPAGIESTMYKIGNGEWQEYKEVLTFSQEGVYKVEFSSQDKDGNVEDVKTVEFNIDKTTPTVSISTDIKIIWPPDGKFVPVKIIGSSWDENLSNTTIEVIDEYGRIEPEITDFDQTIKLEAKRNGNDKDGRVYKIFTTAMDKAGNTSTANASVIVSHDKRK